MNKRTQIMLFTAFSLVIGPLIILGFLFRILGDLLGILGFLFRILGDLLGILGFLFRILGDLLGILGWLCWMEPRMAVRDWNKLKDKIKLAWKN